MNWKDEDLPALFAIESSIVRVRAGHGEMNDYTAGRAYEAAYKFYRTRCRGGEPARPALKGLDLETFNAVQAVCEELLTAGAAPIKGSPKGETKPVAVEKLVDYLSDLVRSVERHTKSDGRYGYLDFLRRYIPKY